MGASEREFGTGEVVAGRYRLDAPVGEGSYGTVFRATNLGGGPLVAVKLLHFRHTARDAVVKRFQREAALVARLDHPNIVKVFDYGHTEAGVPFIVFELLEGQSLRDKVRAEGALGLRRVASIAMQVLAALDHAHRMGVVHRDIKPANIFLCAGRDSDYARVVDFGIAKGLLHDDRAGTQLTASGQMLGTPRYMTPEQIKGGDIGCSVDLYALGLVVAEATSGRPVVVAETAMDVLMAHLLPAPLPLTEGVRDSPFGPVIARAIEKDPARRYPTAAAMAADLQAAWGQLASPGTPVVARAPTPPARGPATLAASPPRLPARGRRTLVIAGVAGLVATGVAGALIAWRTSAKSSHGAGSSPSAVPTVAVSVQPSATAEPVRPSATPPPPPPPQAALTGSEIERRLVAAGWTIDADAVRDARSQRFVHSLFVIRRAPGLEGSVELTVWSDESAAAAAFREADGRVPPDVRLGRDGPRILVVRVANDPDETVRLTELLTR